tara:strand:- start:9936 stop:10229 length:294 start_codon:yes stop_codon:yes gene_type:complete
VQRPECRRTGVYFLVGPDPDNALRPLVWIGESDDVAKRLKQHNQPEDKGATGKQRRQGFLGAGVFDHQQGSEPHQTPWPTAWILIDRSLLFANRIPG